MSNIPPVILILNASALSLAKKIKAILGGDTSIYALQGKIDGFPQEQEFAKISDCIQTFYQQNSPIIAICASGIVVRALAPVLGQGENEPPVLSVAIDGSSIVPLLGVTSGANEMARQIASALSSHAAITTSGELRFGLNLLVPPPDLELVNRQDGKRFISKLLDGAAVQLAGIDHDWLSQSQLPIAADAILKIHVVAENEKFEVPQEQDRLIYRLKKGAKQIAPSHRGRVTIIGLGPSTQRQRTKAVDEALRQADDILGYGFYVEQAGPFRPEQRQHHSDNGEELARARMALDLSHQGRRVALVSSGDAGVFGMAAAFFEMLEQFPKTVNDDLDVDVVVEPGITAALAASSLFGAPLGGDFAIISLSDNLKPQKLIERRLRLAAQSDMTLALYNPVSKARPHQIEQILAILREVRSPTTFIGLGTDIGRAGEKTLLTTLADIKITDITSRTVIIIGSSQSRVFHIGGRQWFYTPRHYPDSEIGGIC